MSNRHVGFEEQHRIHYGLTDAPVFRQMVTETQEMVASSSAYPGQVSEARTGMITLDGAIANYRGGASR
ncbi:hypothetical protein VSDG_04056 [Cytospora chrysosperma]|uniref:Uncharacterized protein n=1 Tax=Cytospora chrysosperma TaxID=252740 RepID=A0A423W147_CYTCH|nr:hypothetical protein VSDG_04056 [Valsa sordida]